MSIDNEFLMVFLDESLDMLDEAESTCLELELNPHNTKFIDILFRTSHNIKGSSRSVGLKQIGDLAHVLENLLTVLKENPGSLETKSVNILLESFDFLKKNIILTSERRPLPNSEGYYKKIEEAVNSIDSPPKRSKKTSKRRKKVSKKVKKSTEHKESGLFLFDEDTPQAPQQIETDVKTEVQAMTQEPKNPTVDLSSESVIDQNIKVSLSRVEKLINYVGEMTILSSVLKEQSTIIKSQLIRNTINHLGKITKEIQSISMNLRMVPIGATFRNIRRIARDTATVTNKEIQLFVSGEESEVDKTIVDHIKDPLVHLIRNAVDHGIESPEERESVNKPRKGTIHIDAYHQSGKFVIDIRDDGKGIDTNRLREKAKKNNLHPDPYSLDESEACKLVFVPGLSSRNDISDVSGRGVGMDVVKSSIDKIGGEISVETTENKGTLFQIILPQSLAIIDAMVVEDSNCKYVIPVSFIFESLQLNQNDVCYTHTMGEIYHFRGENIPFYRLSSVLNGPDKAIKTIERPIIMIIQTADKLFAVMVDSIIGHYQVVIKHLGYQAENLPGIIGSAILGDGKPSLILDLGELIESKGAKKVNIDQHELKLAI